MRRNVRGESERRRRTFQRLRSGPAQEPGSSRHQYKVRGPPAGAQVQAPAPGKPEDHPDSQGQEHRADGRRPPGSGRPDTEKARNTCSKPTRPTVDEEHERRGAPRLRGRPQVAAALFLPRTARAPGRRPGASRRSSRTARSAPRTRSRPSRSRRATGRRRSRPPPCARGSPPRSSRCRGCRRPAARPTAARPRTSARRGRRARREPRHGPCRAPAAASVLLHRLDVAKKALDTLAVTVDQPELRLEEVARDGPRVGGGRDEVGPDLVLELGARALRTAGAGVAGAAAAARGRRPGGAARVRLLLRAAGLAEEREPADHRVARPADPHSLFHGLSLTPADAASSRPARSRPAGPISFFQIGTRALRVSMISSAHRNAGARCGAPTATTRLTSPTGEAPDAMEYRDVRESVLLGDATRDRRRARVRPSGRYAWYSTPETSRPSWWSRTHPKNTMTAPFPRSRRGRGRASRRAGASVTRTSMIADATRRSPAGSARPRRPAASGRVARRRRTRFTATATESSRAPSAGKRSRTRREDVRDARALRDRTARRSALAASSASGPNRRTSTSIRPRRSLPVSFATSRAKSSRM